MSAPDEEPGDPVDCPACRGGGTVPVISRWFGARWAECGPCEGSGRVTADRAAEVAAADAEARITADDERAHAWAERCAEREDGR